jgi:hypothetical protein
MPNNDDLNEVLDLLKPYKENNEPVQETLRTIISDLQSESLWADFYFNKLKSARELGLLPEWFTF